MKRVVLVTGGTRGIGRACVEEFARNGYAVLFFCRERTDLADQLTKRLRAAGCDVDWMACDVADREQVFSAVRQILQRYHRIDVLVNNAGVAQIKLFTDLSEQDWASVFAVNVNGVFHCAQAVLPGMISEKSGAIINVSSMWGQVGASCETAYSASKAAVIGLTKALAKEVGPSGIRVNCVAPGVIETDMNAELTDEVKAGLSDETPLGRMGTAEETARAIRFLAGSDAAFITGQVLGVNGGLVI